MKFVTIADFNSQLKSSFVELESKEALLTFGYITPGHGFKGRQQWINEDRDLDEMYEIFGTRKEILIWCLLPRGKSENKGGKRGKSDCDNAAKRHKETQKEARQEDKHDVSDVIKQLQKNHGNKFSIEQFNAWAQLIRLGKHVSLDNPPNYPFFVGRRKQSKAESSDGHTTDSPTHSDSQPTTLNVSFSPGKRIHLRTELLDQIKKLSDLLNDGNISQDQYETMKHIVMKDITTLSSVRLYSMVY